MSEDENASDSSSDDDELLETSVDDKHVMLYCDNEGCSGELIEAKPLDVEECECPVCYTSLRRVEMLVPCGHIFCSTCISSWQNKLVLLAFLSADFCQ